MYENNGNDIMIHEATNTLKNNYLRKIDEDTKQI